MRRSILIAVPLVLMASVVSVATPLDDAQAIIAAAQARLTALAGELCDVADADAKSASALYDTGRQLQEAADRQKRVAPLLADAVAKSLAQAKSALDAAAAQAHAAADAAHAADIDAAAAKADLPARQAAIERAVAAERQAFSNSRPFVDASAAIKQAEAALEQERARLVAASANDPTIAPLAKRAHDAEAAVKAAREAVPTDDARLARASNDWIATQNALSVAQSHLFERDDRYSKAERASAAATRTRAELLDASERSLLTRPAVIAAQQAFRAAQARVPATEAAAAAARAANETAAQSLAAKQADVDALAAISRDGDVFAKAANDVNGVAGSVSHSAAAVRDIAARVTTVCN